MQEIKLTFPDCANNSNKLLLLLEDAYKQGQLLIQEMDGALTIPNEQIKQLCHLVTQFKQIKLLLEQQVKQTTMKANLELELSEPDETYARKFISNVLHHDIAQMLYAVSLKLELLDHTALKSLEHRSLEQLKRSLEEMVRYTISLAAEIHPMIIDDLGVTAALRSYVNSFDCDFKRKLTLELKENLDRYPIEFQHSVFQICRCTVNLIAEYQVSVVSSHLTIFVTGSTLTMTTYISGQDLCFSNARAKGLCDKLDSFIRQLNGEKHPILTNNLVKITYLIPIPE